ncbi:MAG: MBOAT family protein [Mogibacterium sp.]|nr:MBOAT family protein [Mogibacterium sp.]
MLFSSVIFLFWFLPATMILYYIIPKRFIGLRNLILLAASLLFYSWGEPVYVALMIYSIIFNWFMAGQIHAEQERGGSGKWNLFLTVLVNLFILGFFKYFGFLMDTINQVTGAGIRYTALALPIGISFYTFQAMSYIIDVYRGTVAPQKSLLRFAVYLSLFPQLIAGPIVKYRDVAEQLDRRKHSLEKFGEGGVRFILGLGKKVLLANNLGALYASVTALDAGQVSVSAYWIGILAYTFQIYFDFSGYSDMAIGLGRMFGFEFIENFNYPYISQTVTEFWRRWHMSLSSWFRDYVYIPLGGNRVSVPRHILNLMIVWALTGLWHGASWNFVLWGAYYGVILILEKYVYGRLLEKIPGFFRHLYTMIVVIISWVFFSITDFTAMAEYLRVLFGAGGAVFWNLKTLYFLRTGGGLLAASVLLSTPWLMKQYLALSRKGWLLTSLLTMIILVVSVSYLIYGSYNPFLYFRF